jgi:hypothetical protein
MSASSGWGPWKQLDGSGAYVQVKGLGCITGVYVDEIAPGSALEGEPHLFEEVIYYTSVKAGGTLIEYEDEDPEISRIYRTETKKKGISSAMPGSSHVHGG